MKGASTMPNQFRPVWKRRKSAAVLAALLGTAVCLQLSAEPSGAGVLPPSSGTGVVLVTYGRTGNTAQELTWASRGTATIERKSRGNYTITASLVTGAGNAQVSVLGPGAPLPTCSVTSVANANPGTSIKVRCWSATTGRTSDAGFSLMYTSIRNSNPGDTYTVLTTDKSNRSHTPTNQFRADPLSLPATVTRLAKGAYKVTLPSTSMSVNGGVPFVSATGSSPRYCNLAGWQGVGFDTVARVDCFNGSGARADSRFTFSAGEADLTGYNFYPAMNALRGAGYGSSDFETFYTGFGSNHYSAAAQLDETKLEFQPGRSTVLAKNFNNVLLRPQPKILLITAAFALVTGYGSNFNWPEQTGFGFEPTNNRCAVARPQISGNDVVFEVNCYTPAGFPVTASYSIVASASFLPLIT